MKTLHLSIIAVIGIVIIVMTSVGVFIEKLNDNPEHPYTDITITGVKENYTINEPIVFSVIIEGYGSGCGDTRATITKVNDLQYKSPGWSMTPQCVSNPKQNYFKFNAISENTTISQPGNYTLNVSFDDLITYRHITEEKNFSVILPTKTTIHDIDITNNDRVSESNCGQFFTVPQDSYSNGSETYPVLILKQNSIGCAKLTYTINYNYNDNKSGSIWSQMLNFTDMLHIGKYNYTTHGNSFGVSSIDNTQMFKIKSIPEVIDLAKYPAGTQFTVILVIRPIQNTTGFFDYSIEEIPCGSYPLAVGYSPDQVNSSDFSKGMVVMHNHSCFNAPYGISAVQVSGMDVKQVKFQ